jgi:23S rRNA (uridine2552-2'-O)-methyltransferase
MYERKDPVYRRAKQEGYRSRAAYKLLELQRRTRLVRRGDAVVDLGAWPGGWLQVAAELVGPQGRVVGIDVVAIDALPLAQVTCLIADVGDPALPAEVLDLLGRRADVVLLDLAPKLTGVAPRDAARTADLLAAARDFAAATLGVGGSLVVKTFGGAESDELRTRLRGEYDSVRLVGLETTRKRSSELYLVASGRRAP